jgi:hypothetical protein
MLNEPLGSTEPAHRNPMKVACQHEKKGPVEQQTVLPYDAGVA